MQERARAQQQVVCRILFGCLLQIAGFQGKPASMSHEFGIMTKQRSRDCGKHCECHQNSDLQEACGSCVPSS